MSELFHFEYELHRAGWATARIRHGENEIDMTVSYLHDSLRELANAVYAVSRGAAISRVVFMDEPGEYQLTLTRRNGPDCHYSIRWFNDWDSWNIRTLPGSTPVFDGTVPVRQLVQQVYAALWSLYEEFGESGYQELWCEHEFPLAEMQRLVGIKNGQQS